MTLPVELTDPQIAPERRTPRERLRAARHAELERRRLTPENRAWRAEWLARIVRNAEKLTGL